MIILATTADGTMSDFGSSPSRTRAGDQARPIILLASFRSLSGMSFRGSTLSKACFALSSQLIFVMLQEVCFHARQFHAPVPSLEGYELPQNPVSIIHSANQGTMYLLGPAPAIEFRVTGAGHLATVLK